MNTITSLLVVATAVVVAACGAPVEVPTAFAELDCPAAVAVGADINVTGRFTGTQTLAASSLTIIANGTQVIDGDTAPLRFDEDIIVTVTYAATTKEGGTAEARCRFAVGDPVAARIAAEFGDDEDDDVSDVGDDVEEEEEEEEEEEVGPPVDLTGDFAVVAWDAPTISSLALAPNDQCSHARSVSIAHVVQTGSHIDIVMETCLLPMPTVYTSGFEFMVTLMPDAFLAALPLLSYSFDLAHGAAGDRFSPVRNAGPAQTVGSDVDDATDLPVEVGEHVINSDNDDLPGVTLHVGNQDRGVVYRRFVDRFDGVILNSDEIDGGDLGNWQVNSETRMMDPLLSLFRDFVGVSVEGRNSTFKMSRTNATTCDELMANPGLLPAPARPAFPDGCAHYDDRDGAISALPE